MSSKSGRWWTGPDWYGRKCAEWAEQTTRERTAEERMATSDEERRCKRGGNCVKGETTICGKCLAAYEAQAREEGRAEARLADGPGSWAAAGRDLPEAIKARLSEVALEFAKQPRANLQDVVDGLFALLQGTYLAALKQRFAAACSAEAEMGKAPR